MKRKSNPIGNDYKPIIYTYNITVIQPDEIPLQKTGTSQNKFGIR